MAPAEMTAANKPVTTSGMFQGIRPADGAGRLRTKIALIILGNCQGSQEKAKFWVPEASLGGARVGSDPGGHIRGQPGESEKSWNGVHREDEMQFEISDYC